jgi:hypothetical protein
MKSHGDRSERASTDPVALKKTNARLGYTVRKLRHRLAQLHRAQGDEARQQHAEHSAHVGDSDEFNNPPD